jgi:hypothetical protein
MANIWTGTKPKQDQSDCPVAQDQAETREEGTSLPQIHII